MVFCFKLLFALSRFCICFKISRTPTPPRGALSLSHTPTPETSTRNSSVPRAAASPRVVDGVSPIFKFSLPTLENLYGVCLSNKNASGYTLEGLDRPKRF